ncbi:hypothetical protein D9611_012275 [Ephemerocybe angulata]|uniref:Uncharacterized protein n=1 Tax=Ephemerocybe angulata TaxID=980116 RepID=A0A8H5AT80_9AGAR|nr:hypothetical protein D9611_012275 [Tulosesus angulatus]
MSVSQAFASAPVTGTAGPANHEFLGVEAWVAIPDNAGVDDSTGAASTSATVVAAQAGNSGLNVEFNWTMDPCHEYLGVEEWVFIPDEN